MLLSTTYLAYSSAVGKGNGNPQSEKLSYLFVQKHAISPHPRPPPHIPSPRTSPSPPSPPIRSTVPISSTYSPVPWTRDAPQRQMSNRSGGGTVETGVHQSERWHIRICSKARLTWKTGFWIWVWIRWRYNWCRWMSTGGHGVGS